MSDHTKVVTCPISGVEMEPVFSARILNKYNIQYFYSEKSGLLQTEHPYWINEAYSDAIALTDTGILRRNILHTLLSMPILNILANNDSKLVDIGGGYGIFTRLLRDIGYDCYSYDKYCDGVLAKGFEVKQDLSADVLFAFEVFEHIENPMDFINESFTRFSCKTMIFSTQTFQYPIPDKDWDYYSFETGQHITFYQKKTLSILARKNHCEYYSLGNGFHLFTDRKITKFQQWLLSKRRLNILYAFYLIFKHRKFSKTLLDSYEMKGLINSMK